MKILENSMKRLVGEWPLLFVFTCLIFMLHPMLRADFGMIDDHEIVTILGRDNRVGMSEIIPLIPKWAIEHNGRFRPVYYGVRILEASVFGGNASLWYANRLLLALVSALALYWALRVASSPFHAGVATLLLFAGPQNEMWTRLGPQEAYGVPLVLTGVAWISVQLGRQNWQLVRLFPGFALLLLAGFVKESFVPVLPGVLALVYVVIPSIFPSIVPRRPGFRLSDGLILLLLMTGVGTQMWLIAKMLNTYGHQQTAEVSLRSFLAAVRPTLAIYSVSTLWFVPVVAGLATLLPRNAQEWGRQAWRGELTKAIVLLAAGSFLFLLPQLLVYAGNSLPGRYLAPGNLFIIFAAALGLYLLSSKLVEGTYVELRGVVAGMLIAVALFRALGTYRDANGVVLATKKFQTRLAEIVQLKTQHPELPLLFYSTKTLDREPLVSVARFLAVKLPTPERPFLNTFTWERDADSPKKIKLAQLMRAQSLEGDQNFAKIVDFHNNNGQCIAVVFSDSIENVRCNYAVQVLE
jgi:hypothetical protein